MREEDYRHLADIYVGRLVDSLGDRLTAVLLSGSVSTGDVVPGESDLDLTIILGRENYESVETFSQALTTISSIYQEIRKEYPSLSWHGPRIYNEDVYPFIDHDHNPTDTIMHQRSGFVFERYPPRRDFHVRMAMRRLLFSGSRGIALHFDPEQAGKLWGWLRFHFRTTALSLLTERGYSTTKTRVLPDIQKVFPTPNILEACRILADPSRSKTPSQEDFWTLVEAVEEVAQNIFHEPRQTYKEAAAFP